MTFKTVGLILCAAGIAAGGWYIGERIRRSQKDLSFLLRLTEHVYTEVRYAHTELPQCFHSFSEPEERRTVEKMARGEYREALQALSLPKETRIKLCTDYELLGSGTLDEELLKIERIRDYLRKENDKAAKKTGGSVRSARVLGICIAAALLLLFL